MSLMGTAKPGTLVTIYTVGGFGAKTTRAKVNDIREVANGNGRRAIDYTPKGKRKAERDSSKTLVVVVGHDHPDAPGGLVDTGNGQSSRYGSFDPRYATDFNKWVRLNIIEKVSPDLVLIDQRETPDETDPTFDRI